MKTMAKSIMAAVIFIFCFSVYLPAAEPIRHDAEHYVLLHQYKDQWAAEDKKIDKPIKRISFNETAANSVNGDISFTQALSTVSDDRFHSSLHTPEGI